MLHVVWPSPVRARKSKTTRINIMLARKTSFALLLPFTVLTLTTPALAKYTEEWLGSGNVTRRRPRRALATKRPRRRARERRARLRSRAGRNRRRQRHRSTRIRLPLMPTIRSPSSRVLGPSATTFNAATRKRESSDSPQSRARLILRAVAGGALPSPALPCARRFAHYQRRGRAGR